MKKKMVMTMRQPKYGAAPEPQKARYQAVFAIETMFPFFATTLSQPLAANFGILLSRRFPAGTPFGPTIASTERRKETP